MQGHKKADFQQTICFPGEKIRLQQFGAKKCPKHQEKLRKNAKSAKNIVESAKICSFAFNNQNFALAKESFAGTHLETLNKSTWEYRLFQRADTDTITGAHMRGQHQSTSNTPVLESPGYSREHRTMREYRRVHKLKTYYYFFCETTDTSSPCCP